jgi:aryl-alcohol dehydrogenase-like predicted oxidoreductase
MSVTELDELRPLGATGVRVSPLCLGAMMFGAWGNPDHDSCVAIVRHAIDAGINFIDTADVYSFGESEQIIGKALAGVDRERVVLATKFHSPMGHDPNMQGGSRRWIVKACEDSLRRLGTDYIDLYQMHRPDPATDIDETLGALSDLVHQGKIRMIGTSTFPAELLLRAAGARTLPHRAAAVLNPCTRDRGACPTNRRAARHRRRLLESTRRRLALGSLRTRSGEHERT